MKVVLYIDMNAFFVSCHRAINPFLRNKPIVVSSSSRRAIVSSASYEARKYQIKSGMPLYKAKQQCSSLICIEADFKLYASFSRKIFQLLKNQITNKIEISSTDEYCLDITDNYQKYGTVKQCAQYIQKLILTQLNLPSSLGISYNKFLAKMASKINKPYGVFIFNASNIHNVLWKLNIAEMYGIGLKTAIILQEKGIKTIGDLASSTNFTLLKEILGIGYIKLQKQAQGLNTNDFEMEFQNRKSISNDLTLEYDTTDIKDINEYLLLLANKIHLRAKTLLVVGKKITCAFKTENRQWHSKQITLSDYINGVDQIYSTSLWIFEQLWNQQPIRALRINLSKIIDAYQVTKQLELFSPNVLVEEKHKNALQSKLIKTINERYKKEISLSGENYLQKYHQVKTFKF